MSNQSIDRMTAMAILCDAAVRVSQEEPLDIAITTVHKLDKAVRHVQETEYFHMCWNGQHIGMKHTEAVMLMPTGRETDR